MEQGMNAPEAYLLEAIALARRSIGSTEPNPRVGCVIVSPDGRTVLGEGHTPVSYTHLTLPTN